MRDLASLDQQLCFALYSASRAFTRAYAPLLEPLGLTYLQYVVMLVLWERDDLSVKALGERLSLDSGTLTPLLKRLESAGFVERARSREDERVVRIKLTRAGRALEPAARAVPIELLRRAGYPQNAATRERLKTLRAELEDLTERLERSLAEPSSD
ncbi:MAG: MarR family transcriptional regulator [Polyangiaceae bacterium]